MKPKYTEVTYNDTLYWQVPEIHACRVCVVRGGKCQIITGRDFLCATTKMIIIAPNEAAYQEYLVERTRHRLGVLSE